jgi:hypothetical protein
MACAALSLQSCGCQQPLQYSVGAYFSCVIQVGSAAAAGCIVQVLA